jgi:hypothetical protein
VTAVAVAAPWFLRIADPAEAWDGTSGPSLSEAAELLANDKSWSLFECADLSFERAVLAAIYGSRMGRGPMRPVAIVRLEKEFLNALTNARLDHSPQNFVFAWPQEVAEAHYDLHPMDANEASIILRSVRDGDNVVISVPRLELLLEQVRLLRRPDCADRFRMNVGQRLRKLSANEQPVFQQLTALCTQSQIRPPDVVDFRP